MITPPMPAAEQERLQALYSLDILDTQYEEDFNEVVQLASQICNVPISLISLIDKDRQWFKAKTGLDIASTSRDVSFCAHAIAGGDNELFMVEDTLVDERFHDNPLVLNDPSIRFYAGMPLISSNGFKLGTLCVIDKQPRHLDTKQVFAMKVLSTQVIKLFDLRLNKRQTEEQSKLLNLQKRRLEELNEVQSKIISIISNDIRHPLTSLKQVMQMQATNVINKEQVISLMVIINTQVDGTVDMLDNLVEWSNILSQKSTTDLQPLQLYPIVNEAFKAITSIGKLKSNELINEVGKSLTVTGDEAMLAFILKNLLSNANKYTAAGTISIRTEVLTNDRVKIIIQDTGTGMSNNVLNRLFTQNQRAGSVSGTDNEKGRGIGLMLVKDFIEKLGSKIVVESNLGFGTVVSFTLPT